MPDLLRILKSRWKFISGFTLLAGVVALTALLLSPKKYLSTATALPANSVVADKARLFNPNIEALYSDFGSPDELDRLEGTALLDTIFIAAAQELDLAAHYGTGSNDEKIYKTATRLKKNSHINRTGYGELKVKVWDTDRVMAATLANKLMQKIQQLHQHLQNESNSVVLQQLLQDHLRKEQQYRSLADSGMNYSKADADLWQVKKSALLEQLMQEEKMIDQYRLAISTSPQVLMIVENARPSVTPDKPDYLPVLLFTLFGAFLFAYFISLIRESSNRGTRAQS